MDIDWCCVVAVFFFLKKSSCMWLKLLNRSCFPGSNVSHCKLPEEKCGGLKLRSRRLHWIKITPNTFSSEHFPAFSMAIDCSLKEWTDHFSSWWAWSTKTCLWTCLFLSGDFSFEAPSLPYWICQNCQWHIHINIKYTHAIGKQNMRSTSQFHSSSVCRMQMQH